MTLVDGDDELNTLSGHGLGDSLVQVPASGPATRATGAARSRALLVLAVRQRVAPRRRRAHELDGRLEHEREERGPGAAALAGAERPVRNFRRATTHRASLM
ncbi:MAG TPA: hypothetical protein VFD84_18175 [Candidatus Binatia bacterium]|jgi:hypothetical protein|nr:hypothetical protein [Candidatus Binatia bacterium]